MRRNIDINEISDGRLYTANDMAKTDCHDCKGCFACCKGMGESIVLDPLDIHRITVGLNTDFTTLLNDKIQLNIVDGLTLPNLNMSGENEACRFLNDQGRCTIHSIRPGICRMFPLGRIYMEDSFKYFLQVNECPVKDKGKVKIKKWLDIPEIKKYEEYILKWHGFIVQCREAVAELSDEQIRILSILILRTFYETQYEEEFYNDFYSRLNKIKEQLRLE